MADYDYPAVMDEEDEKKKGYPMPIPSSATAPMPTAMVPPDVAGATPPTFPIQSSPPPATMTREPESGLVRRGDAMAPAPINPQAQPPSPAAPAPMPATPPKPIGPQPTWNQYAPPEPSGMKRFGQGVATFIEPAMGKFFAQPEERAEAKYGAATKEYEQRVGEQERGKAAQSEAELKAAQAKEHEAGAAAKTAGMENIQVQIPPELGGGTANIPKGKEEDFFKALAQIRGRENAAENKPAPKQNDFEQYYNDFITENKLPDSAHNRLLAREKYASAGQAPQRPDAEDKAVKDHLEAQGLPDTPANRDRARLELTTGKVAATEEAKGTAKVAELGKSAQASYKRLQALVDKDNDPANYAFLMSFIGMSYEAIKGARLNQAEIVRAAATRTLPDQLQHLYDLYINKRILTKEQKAQMLDTAKTIAGTYEENANGNEGQKFNEGDRRTHKQTGEVQEYRGGKWQTVTPPKQ